MARIRTIKPDFFRHEGLYEAEIEFGLPLRVAFAGIWTVADREGRFKWNARTLRLDALPFDEVDFSRVLDALLTRGHIAKYTVDGKDFGFIPSWSDHQVVNNREANSILPEPTEQAILDASTTREPRVTVASVTPLKKILVEGKGREGKDASLTQFENLWEAYPKKKSRADAEKAWAKIKPSEHLAEQILQAVQRAKTSKEWIKNGGEFIPYPASWLNAKGWLDEDDSNAVPAWEM